MQSIVHSVLSISKTILLETRLVDFSKNKKSGYEAAELIIAKLCAIMGVPTMPQTDFNHFCCTVQKGDAGSQLYEIKVM